MFNRLQKNSLPKSMILKIFHLEKIMVLLRIEHATGRSKLNCVTTTPTDRIPQTPITVHLINTGNEQLATGNSIRRRHERRKSRFNFIHGVKIPTRRFCTIGVYLEKSNLAQKHLVAVLS